MIPPVHSSFNTNNQARVSVILTFSFVFFFYNALAAVGPQVPKSGVIAQQARPSAGFRGDHSAKRQKKGGQTGRGVAVCLADPTKPWTELGDSVRTQSAISQIAPSSSSPGGLLSHFTNQHRFCIFGAF